jgi:hypothetical protein
MNNTCPHCGRDLHRKSKQEQLLEVIQGVESIFNSEADWQYKYNRVFKNLIPIRILCSELGISLEWCDPDTTYQEDVTAFVSAILEIKKNLEIEIASRGKETSENE